jgi:hypothetical protein
MLSMNTEIAWNVIAEIGWGRKTTDYNAVRKTLLESYSKFDFLYLKDFVSARKSDLYKRVKEWEKNHRKLGIYSDDGFDDVISHTVGLGKNEFEKVMANPPFLEGRYNAPYASVEGYKESFSYCFQVK